MFCECYCLADYRFVRNLGQHSIGVLYAVCKYRFKMTDHLISVSESLLSQAFRGIFVDILTPVIYT